MNKELVTKAKEAKNTAELIALGKENGIDLTERLPAATNASIMKKAAGRTA